jgi:hypothetical protein
VLCLRRDTLCEDMCSGCAFENSKYKNDSSTKWKVAFLVDRLCLSQIDI